MKISRILHAGYIFEHNDTKIIFDPIFENPFSGNCFAFPHVEFDLKKIRALNFSAIFISHFHDDHCSFESLDLFDRSTPIYIHCLHDELFEMIRELGFTRVHQLRFNDAVTVNDFAVTPRRPIDDDVDSMLQINVGGLNILNVVDSVIDPDTLEILKAEAPWDLVLWPFQTMRETAVLTPSRNNDTKVALPEEWIDELKTLNPRFIVPSACQFVQESWSWYNNALFPITYRKFNEEISANLPESKVVKMNPGTSFLLDHKSLQTSEALNWVRPLGNQEVDYLFAPDKPTPSAAEIAKHFASLEPIESDRVISFCTDELLKRYRTLSSSPYFEQARAWQLSIFDHDGTESKFHYKIDKSTIELAESANSPTTKDVAWITEVAIAKLFAALERGETLTSMYMRVNDTMFSNEAEVDLKEMDVLEDPLIRTLFEGRFGSYQRNQLRRFKSKAADLA